jgi:hypothetical protein
MILIFLDITSHQKRVELHIKKACFIFIFFTFSLDIFGSIKRESKIEGEKEREKKKEPKMHKKLE